ncbi:hypothetical protein [Puniceibacterium confluentis]|uniref:hypothetical protein n=1 Tax=Puniceibacterium confluentis TaxID=1958944 RepID=UPI0011B557E6|nr:hypothetical protein [Puniceibacterium confluentis]
MTSDALKNDFKTSVEKESHEASFDRVATALEQYLCNPDTNDFDVGVRVASRMFRDGKSLPGWLAKFAADVLEGKRVRPTKRGPDRYAYWERDYTLCKAVSQVSTRFGLPEYTENELSRKVTAAEIVAEVAGVSINVVTHAVKKFRDIIIR